MKRLLFLILIVLAVAMPPLAAQGKGPNIAFDSITHNVGKIPEGDMIRDVFKFTNKGNATLEIISVDASCGCTSALLSKNKIEPGQSGEIEVKIETKDLGVSEITKTVTVTSNDPKQSQVVLTINGIVEPEFSLSEPALFFGSVARGKEVTKEITITLPQDKQIKLLSAVSTDENVTVKMEPVTGSNGKQFKIVAVQKATAPEGYHFGNIVIKTTSVKKPELKISVRGIVTKGN